MCEVFITSCPVFFVLSILNCARLLQFLTDGMLVREMMADPLLKKYRYEIVIKALYLIKALYRSLSQAIVPVMTV